MSEKAVGTDWLNSSKYTLRHCAANHVTGDRKFIKKNLMPAGRARRVLR